MIFLRLTLCTCAFYCALALPIVGELVLERGYGFSMFFHGRSGLAVFAAFWGLIWLASFLLAFRIVFGTLIWRAVWISR